MRRSNKRRMSHAAICAAVGPFLSAVVERVASKGIDVGGCTADHVCWRCETLGEYQAVCADLAAHGAQLLVEGMIGGRPISTYQLREPLRVETGAAAGAFEVECVEVPCPKAGRFYASGLEHAEFVVGGAGAGVVGTAALEEFRARHPGVAFDERALGKHVNPDLGLALGEFSGAPVSCKFHHRPLSEVVEYELAHHCVERVPQGYFER